MFVDGMLLMSGFLLFLPYAREKAEGVPVPSVGQYYRNRVVRIVPSYLLGIVLAFFLIALPQGKYITEEFMVRDVVTHLTFTFNFWRDTCLHTPLNGALWTVAVEMQFYLIFPFLARATQRKPALTLGLMGLAGLAYRAYLYTQVQDTALLLNQMPSFFDVYALGMLGAMIYVEYARRPKEKIKILPWVSIIVFAASLYGIISLLKMQASASGYEGIRQSQLLLRLPFTLVLLWAMLSAAVMPRFLQKLLDNRLLRFIAAISYNLYIWHQVLAVQLRQAFFPATLHGDRPLQWAYSLLCFSVAILAAMAATYGVERPCVRLARNISSHRRKKHYEGSQTANA